MGLILDTGILIAEERRRGTILNILRDTEEMHGEVEIAVSSISVVELTHGIYRAKTDAERERRRDFASGTFSAVPVHPVTFEIAQLAGRIDGEQAAKGIAIGFEDLVIGATALYLGYDLATYNVKHFELIPGLKIVSL
jgi:predicted nucleic acid-binding protein